MSTISVHADGQIATDVVVADDAVASFALPERAAREQVVVLAQPGEARSVARRVVANIPYDVSMIELPDRDAAKTWSVVADIQHQMAELGMGRHDTIVGVGGGAATDVAGFVAATWMRGIEAVYVPTTLLAAVDAAVGGKTGINLAGKNLVGSFAHPTRVVVDTAILDALPLAIKREGWSEAIKTGFIADEELVRIFEQNPENPPTAEIVERSIRVKAEVVSADFKEGGRRKILNFGHTIGHGVEFAQGCSHGEGVAIGMVAAAAISRERFGWDYPMAETLGALGLPSAATAHREDVDRLVHLDKKRTAAGIGMVLLSDIATPEIVTVTDAELAIGYEAIALA